MPRLVIPDGSVEALKWLALILMTADHINKYLFNGTIPILFNAGRLALPIFAFSLAYNLARPGNLTHGAYARSMQRLAIFGVISTPMFIALGGLLGGWWPLNVMFTFLIVTAVLFLFDSKKPHIAVVVFLLGGGLVEYWWPALLISLATWWYRKKPSLLALLLFILGLSSLWFVNKNLWAFTCLPLIALAVLFDLKISRFRWVFYIYYPLHLLIIYLIRNEMKKYGYLFF